MWRTTEIFCERSRDRQNDAAAACLVVGEEYLEPLSFLLLPASLLRAII
jgi:hypothetical protein